MAVRIPSLCEACGPCVQGFTWACVCVRCRNFPTYANHDQFEGLVFVDKHTQPSSDPCLNSLMHQCVRGGCVLRRGSRLRVGAWLLMRVCV
jgi:hypothetical protein